MKISFVISVFVIAALVWPQFGIAQEEIAMTVSGEVVDANTKKPIQGATVSVQEHDVTPVQTNEKGKFKFIVICSQAITVDIEKDGYNSFSMNMSPQREVKKYVTLEKGGEIPSIEHADFVSRSHIKGSIAGIPEERYGAYKVIVYVLTNKWYIHPSAVDVEGQGYARINRDGTWRIGTVFRGYQARRVAFLLVPKDTSVPSTVDAFGMDPNGALISRIDNVAYEIIEAPTGI